MSKLYDLEVYKVSIEIGEMAWNVVNRWHHFDKDTLGKQFTRAADSIAFNISEGYGRFHFAENRNFCYYSRGSAFETLTAINKAKTRRLLNDDEYTFLNTRLEHYFKLINGYIKSIGQTSRQGNDQ